MPKKMSETKTPVASSAGRPQDGGYLPQTPVAVAAQEGRLPRIHSNHYPFFLVHAPSLWELVHTEDHGWELLPILKRVDLKPGCNGVKARKGRAPPDLGRLFSKLREDGMQILEPVTDYTTSVDSEGGPRYFAPWERVRAYPDGAWEMDEDIDARRAYQRAQRARLAPPRPSQIAAMRNRFQKHLTRAQQRQPTDYGKRKIAEAEKQLRGLDEAYRKLTEPEESTDG